MALNTAPASRACEYQGQAPAAPAATVSTKRKTRLLQRHRSAAEAAKKRRVVTATVPCKKDKGTLLQRAQATAPLPPLEMPPAGGDNSDEEFVADRQPSEPRIRSTLDLLLENNEEENSVPAPAHRLRHMLQARLVLQADLQPRSWSHSHRPLARWPW